MKRFLIIILIFFFPATSFAVPVTPTGLTPTASETVINVSWTANTDTVIGYYIYWGTSDTNLDFRKTIGSATTTSYSITGLSPNIAYYVAISSFDSTSESAKSATIKTTTLAGATPAAPSGFSITSISEITNSSVGLKWTKNSETDIDRYKIYYGITSENYSVVESTSSADVNSYTLSNLSSRRYYIALTAIDLSGNESAKSSEIIVDILPDTSPPNTPGTPTVSITGEREINVSFTGNNTGMVDLRGYKIYYGTASGSYGSPVDIGTSTSYVLSDLSENTNYFVAVSSYDYSGNESAKSTEVSTLMEGGNTLLSNPNSFQGGCFIATAVFGSYDHPMVKILREFRDTYLLKIWLGKKIVNIYYKFSPTIAEIIKQSLILRLITLISLFPVFMLCFLIVKIGLLSIIICASLIILMKFKTIRFIPLFLLLFTGISMAQEDNTFGFKVGYLYPSNKIQRDIYTKSSAVGILFYDRRLFEHISFDLEGGYVEQSGEILTQSGKSTKIKTILRLAPISTSLKWNIKFTSFLESYLGGGVDYWYYNEENNLNRYEGFVSGYHGKIGIKLISISEKGEEYYPVSFLVETIYSKIDRFSRNSTEIGGWIFNIGFSHSF